MIRSASLGSLPTHISTSTQTDGPAQLGEDSFFSNASATTGGTSAPDQVPESSVVTILKEEREFSDKVGAVFDKLVLLLQDKRGGARLRIEEDNSANTLKRKKVEEITSKTETINPADPEVTMDSQANVTPVLVITEGIANYCFNKIRESFDTIVQFYQRKGKTDRASNSKNHEAGKTIPVVKPTAQVSLPITKRLMRVWDKIQNFFIEIREGVEKATGTEQKRVITEQKPAAQGQEGPLTVYERINKILDRVWNFLLEIQAGVEKATATQQKSMVMEEKLPTLAKGFIDQIVAFEERQKKTSTDDKVNKARIEYARKFEKITNAKVDNSIRDAIESKMYSVFPFLGFFQNEKKKAENMETYYAIKTMFGGCAGEYFGEIAKKAGIDLRTKCNWKLPWTRGDIEKLVRTMASVNKDELHARFKDIEKRRLCATLLKPLRNQAPAMLDQRPEIFFDTWRIARCSLKATTHFMNQPPDVTGIEKGLDHSDYIRMSLMEEEENALEQWSNARSDPQALKKLQSDFLVGFAQENLGHPVENESILFTPYGLYKNHKNLDKGGALVHYYKPHTSGMSHLIAFPGMRISDSMSADDWLSRRNVFYSKMGVKSYDAIKVNLTSWLTDISDRIERNKKTKEEEKVPNYKENDSVTLLAKSLGTTYAQRLLVDNLEDYPIDQAILIAGTGIENQAHLKFEKALEERKKKRETPVELTYYRHIKDVVPTVGGDHLGSMTTPPDNLAINLNLYSNESEITPERMPRSFLKDTITKEPDNASIFKKWQGSITRAFAHLSNIWDVLHKLAEYDHLGQFHRWLSTEDRIKNDQGRALPTSLHLYYGKTYSHISSEEQIRHYEQLHQYLRPTVLNPDWNKKRSVLFD